MKILLIFLIKIYQKIFSIDHSFWGKRLNYKVCIHYPTCSEYTILAIEKYGVFLGILAGSARIIRCNSFFKPKIDFPKDKFWDNFKK